MGLTPSFVRNGSEKFLVRVDARTAALIRDRMPLRPLERTCNRLRRHIFHKGRLQSRQAAAEHRIDWKPAEELEDSGEKRIIRSEHHRRADEKCIGERRSNRQRELFEHAISMGELNHTVELNGQVARFLHQHKDDGQESA
jgi:hypothetical protein